MKNIQRRPRRPPELAHRSASSLVLVRTRLWTEKPVWRQERSFLMEDTGLVHSALGHQEAEVRVKIYRFPKVWMAAMTPGRSSLPVTISK